MADDMKQILALAEHFTAGETQNATADSKLSANDINQYKEALFSKTKPQIQALEKAEIAVHESFKTHADQSSPDVTHDLFRHKSDAQTALNTASLAARTTLAALTKGDPNIADLAEVDIRAAISAQAEAIVYGHAVTFDDLSRPLQSSPRARAPQARGK